MMSSLNLVASVWLKTLRFSVPTIVEAARGTLSRQVCNERLDSWSRCLVNYAGIRLEVIGREHIRAGTGYIVMSNHQSSFDIPVLFQALQIPLRMVAKKEIFQIPFVGRAMRAAGFIEVDRENRRRAIRALITARQRLDASMSVWIAPEGGRSRTGQLGEFERGGFLMAVSTGMPILPVTIDGTRHTLPAGRLTLHRGNTVRVTISAPIDPADFAPKGIDRLISITRDVIARHLSEPPNQTGLQTKSLDEEKDQGSRDLALRFHSGTQSR
jgi:1-acyl-sn-glycerol-3-phosphate acyltransferase